MDLRTVYDKDGMRCDWLFAAPELATDDALETAVILSLFTDRLANADDALPDSTGQRRGWWGDSFADVDGDRIGSRLWLLAREKQLPAVLERARAYARESLAWMVEDGIARGVEVEAEFPRLGAIAIEATILRAIGGPVRFRFEAFWGVSNAV